MTATIDLSAPMAGLDGRTGLSARLLRRLVRSEFRKMTTTRAWWIFAGTAILTTVLSMLFNMLQATSDLDNIDPTWTANQRARQVGFAATDVFTSGEFAGALMAMLMAILLLTNEYHHQTVTMTFLASPNRTAVVLAKAIVAFAGAVVLWLVVTAIDLVWGILYLHGQGVSNHLSDPTVDRTILAGLLVYGLWALFGLGLGALLRSQIWASVVGAMVYTVGYALSWIAFDLISETLFNSDRADGWSVIAPAVAAQVAVSSKQPLPHTPPEWVGLAVMLGYGFVMTTIGLLIIKRRDIS